MKGQYLALESMLVVAIGLTLAIGAISLFEGYQSRLFETGERAQVISVKAKIMNGLNQVSRADTAQKRLELPDTIAGDDYRVELDDTLLVATRGETYRYDTNLEGYDMSGSSRSGDVSLIKSGNEIILRSR